MFVYPISSLLQIPQVSSRRHLDLNQLQSISDPIVHKCSSEHSGSVKFEVLVNDDTDDS